MASEPYPPSVLIAWSDKLRNRGLGDLALWMLDVLRIWGFAGGQLLWMLAPFVGEETLGPLARTLEQPERLERVRDYLLERRG